MGQSGGQEMERYPPSRGLRNGLGCLKKGEERANLTSHDSARGIERGEEVGQEQKKN